MQVDQRVKPGPRPLMTSVSMRQEQTHLVVVVGGAKGGVLLNNNNLNGIN